MRVVAVMVWVGLIAGATGTMLHVQGSARRDLEAEFGAEVREDADFVQLYVEEVFRRQRDQAIELLSAAAPSDERFELVTSSLGYPASVLLDDLGRVLSIAPAAPARIGEELTSGYDHLRQAVAGRDALSGVVPSAVTGLPIVAFAVPFDTPSGRRVFSGGLEASNMPLASFLENAVGAGPADAYLIDAASGLVTTSGVPVSPGQTLRSHNPALADALGQRTAGMVRVGEQSTYFTSAAVAGTSWRLVAAMHAADLYGPMGDSQMMTARLLVATLGIGGLAMVVFVVRLSDAAHARRTSLALLEANASQLASALDAAIEGSKRLAEAQSLAHLGSWEWDIEADTVSLSNELYRILDLEPHDVEASLEVLLSRLHPDDRATVEDAVYGRRQTHEPLSYPTRILTDDGELRWIEVQAEVTTAVDGAPLRMAGTVLDITDRVRARDKLEASELRFTSGFEHSPIGIGLMSTSGRYLKVNPALCRMLGRDEVTLLTMTLQELTHPEDLGLGVAELRAVTSGESASCQAEKRYVLTDGEVMWAQVNSSVVPGEAGTPDYVFSQVQDITQKKALADAVVRDREFLAAVLHNLSDGVVACDADGVLTLFNRATQEFHDLPMTASTEDDWAARYNLYRADGVTPMAADDVPLSRAFRGEDVRDAEMVIVPQGAPQRVVRVSAQAIRDAAGNVLGAVAAMHDVTEHKQAVKDLAYLNADLERRVRERTAEAERANEAKSEFLSRMSHELRTPLNSMLGFAQLLGMEELRPDQAESLEHIMSGGRHLLTLINDVLDLAITESGSLAMSLEPVSLGEVLDEALGLIRPQAAAAAVSLPAQAPAGADVHVMADHRRMRQIVLNLLSNAVKYNSEAGTVSLTCERSDNGTGRVRVSVTDAGPGISEEEAQRIFLPFERLSAADTAVEGTGLGLAISKRLADAMGADLGLTSVVGQGSTFWVDLTVVDPEELSAETAGAKGWNPGPGVDPATVLYIEDNLSNLQLVRALLSRVPYVRLLTATSGHTGLELAQRCLPDLVLLDLGLADLSGAEVLKSLRANASTAAIPVVVVSADATDSQPRRLLAAGAAAYLTKPIDVVLFLATVEDTIQTKRGQPVGGANGTTIEPAATAADPFHRSH